MLPNNMNQQVEFSDYPKILVIGQPFHNKSGGGITISNLFKNFPKSNIALATDYKNVGRNDYTYCKNVYRLGNKEYKIFFPFSLVFKTGNSGAVTELVPTANNVSIISKKKWYYTILENIFFKLGINLLAIRITSTKDLEIWIEKFNPDIIYTQLGSIELLLFIEKFMRRFNKPLAIHIMDDWPVSIGRGPLKYYWSWLIDKKLKSVVNYSSINLAISEGMSNEYALRYSKQFDFFHNPIELDKWITKVDINSSNKKNFRILYTGRISGEHYKSLEDICIAINNIQRDDLTISIDVYSPDWDIFLVKKITRYPNVFVYPSIDHKGIPNLLVQYDILFLPLDFSKNSTKFTKLSMPTKASEYLISGVPILIYAPYQSELFRHFEKHKLAFVIGERSLDKLQNGISKLVKDTEYRTKISNNAVEYAKANYNAEIVRERFFKTINLKRN